MVIVNDFPTNAEYFRVIDGFPNYDVSTDGRVRNSKTGRIMKLTVRQDGYIRVGLTKDDNQSYHLVHRLVARAFIWAVPVTVSCRESQGWHSLEQPC